jgi:hypothetical protein
MCKNRLSKASLSPEAGIEEEGEFLLFRRKTLPLSRRRKNRHESLTLGFFVWAFERVARFSKRKHDDSKKNRPWLRRTVPKN